MKNRNPLFVILFTVFLDMLGIGILIPVIPVLLADPASPSYILPAGMSIKTGYIILGLLIATFPLMVFLAAPILGQLSDRFGRRKILVISLAGTCVGYVIFAIAVMTRNIPLLFLSRALDGITGGNISVAQAVIADITPPEKRSRTFGLIGAAFGLGFIIGPFLGGVLADPKIVSWFTAATPFWFAAGLSLLNMILLIILLPETHTPAKDAAVEMNKSIKNIMRAFSHVDLRIIFAAAFLFQAGFAFYITFFSVFLIDRFGATPGQIGLYFAYVGIWIVIAQVLITRKLNNHFREDQVLKISILAMGVVISFYIFITHWWELLFFAPMLAISNGVTQANIPGLISRSSGKEVQGQVLGLNTSVQALAQSIPPVLSGIIAALLTPEMPLVVSGATIILAGLFFIFMYKAPSTVQTPQKV
ncbi:MAG: MFS transporter [Nanoarchaeota archaeon]